MTHLLAYWVIEQACLSEALKQSRAIFHPGSSLGRAMVTVRSLPVGNQRISHDLPCMSFWNGHQTSAVAVGSGSSRKSDLLSHICAPTEPLAVLGAPKNSDIFGLPLPRNASTASREHCRRGISREGGGSDMRLRCMISRTGER